MSSETGGNLGQGLRVTGTTVQQTRGIFNGECVNINQTLSIAFSRRFITSKSNELTQIAQKSASKTTPL